jgi:hypothetical protein
VAEGAPLLREYLVKSWIEGSTPSLSAIFCITQACSEPVHTHFNSSALPTGVAFQSVAILNGVKPEWYLLKTVGAVIPACFWREHARDKAGKNTFINAHRILGTRE